MSTVVRLDKLPIEIIHQILNYLQSHEIFISLYNVSKYINGILNIYYRFRLNFQSISLSHFYMTVNHIKPHQVISLTLSNMDNTPGQFRLFLSLLSIKQFTQLQSLQLIQPSNPIDLNRILTDLHQIDLLLSFSILHCQPSSVNRETFELLSSLINTCPSLRRLYLSGALNPLFEYNLLASINHLYFNDNIFNTTKLETIVLRMPHLKSLETAITLNMNYMNLPSLIHLTRLTITIFVNMTNSDISILLSKMSSLIYLQITANGKQWFNGQFWEQYLPSNLLTFQFNFSTQSIHINEQMILESFQTSFWLQIKHWYVMLDYQMNPTMTHLYSLPYCNTQFYYRPSTDNTRMFRSTGPIDTSYMKNVKNLSLDLATLITESNPSVPSIHSFPNVSTLMLADNKGCSSLPPLFSFLQSIVDLTHIVELKLGQFHYPDFLRILYNSMPSLYSLRIAETMFAQLEILDFRNIRSLAICDCLTNVDRMCSMFPHVKELCVRLMAFEQMRQIIESLDETLINVTFRHINQQTQEQLLKWLHEYRGEHRRFSYETDQHMNLHIWLSDLFLSNATST